MRALLFVGLIFIPVFIQSREVVVKKRAIPVPPEQCNDNPIIGILTQPTTNIIARNFPNENYRTYIAASYVKFIEGAGGRVVPIWINQPRAYYEDLLNRINGVLLPGGATFFDDTGYAEAGAHIYDIARQKNDNRIYFPIWGTCLGFELLTYLSANRQEHRSNCQSLNQPLPLIFKNGYTKSRLFKDTPQDLIEIFQTEPVTANFHKFCITEKSLEDYNLDKEWKVLSTNSDWNGFEFISSIEHRNYPFYGVQFHPEKNIYEWISNRNITHTANAIRASQYFAEFFINEARKNRNHFSNTIDEMNSLIYNYSPKFTGKLGSIFLQMYLFTNQPNYARNSCNRNCGISSSSRDPNRWE